MAGMDAFPRHHARADKNPQKAQPILLPLYRRSVWHQWPGRPTAGEPLPLLKPEFCFLLTMSTSTVSRRRPISDALHPSVNYDRNSTNPKCTSMSGCLAINPFTRLSCLRCIFLEVCNVLDFIGNAALTGSYIKDCFRHSYRCYRRINFDRYGVSGIGLVAVEF